MLLDSIETFQTETIFRTERNHRRGIHVWRGLMKQFKKDDNWKETKETR